MVDATLVPRFPGSFTALCCILYTKQGESLQGFITCTMMCGFG